MTQTIRKNIDRYTTEIWADYGMGRTRHAYNSIVRPVTLRELLDTIDFDESVSLRVQEALETMAHIGKTTVWECLNEKTGFSETVGYFSTYRAARAAAEYQNC